MRPDTRRTPGVASPGLDQNASSCNGNTDGTGWLVDGHDIPAHLLASPTLGAWRRARGITSWTVEGRHAYACVLAEEALRQAIVWALDPILIGLARNAHPADITRRLERIVNDLTPEAQHGEAAA